MNNLLELAQAKKAKAENNKENVRVVTDEVRREIMARYEAELAQHDLTSEGMMSKADQAVKDADTECQAILADMERRETFDWKANDLIAMKPKRVSLTHAKHLKEVNDAHRAAGTTPEEPHKEYSEQFPVCEKPASGDFMEYGQDLIFRDDSLPAGWALMYSVNYWEFIGPEWDDTRRLVDRHLLYVGRAIQRSHYWTLRLVEDGWLADRGLARTWPG